MAPHTDWQNTIRARLIDQQAEEEVHREMVQQCAYACMHASGWTILIADQRLARTARDLKLRNKALLRGGLGASASADGWVALFPTLYPTPWAQCCAHDSPSPLLAHLDAELSNLRTELSGVYRSQAAAQNKQLALSDALRDRDEEVRGLREEVRELREARDAGVRKEREWEERWKSRTKDMEVCRPRVTIKLVGGGWRLYTLLTTTRHSLLVVHPIHCQP